MSGTAQENRTGADNAEEKKAMKKNTYETITWQHGNEPLCYAIWFNNNLVRTLYNFHTPKVVDSGIKRRRRVNGLRETEPVAVPCPQQNVDYLETFHLSDKENGAEAKYELGGQNRTHGWTPKLSFILFNTNFNNLYRIYLTLIEKQSGKETGNDGRRDQGNNPCFASEGKQDEDKGFRASIAHQGLEECL